MSGTDKKTTYPAIQAAPLRTTGTSADPTGGQELPPKRPRHARTGPGGRFACNSCRVRKCQCPGDRPACSACRKRNIECVYSSKGADNSDVAGTGGVDVLQGDDDQLRTKVDQQDAGILNRLRTLPKDEALELLEQLRSPNATDTDSRTTSPIITNPAQTSLEFGLMLRHPVSYPNVASSIEYPMLADSESISSGQTPFSSVFDVFTPRSSHISPLSSYDGRPSPASEVEARQTSEQSIPLLQHSISSPLANLCDERLNHIEIPAWSQVAVSNHFASRVLSHYLVTDHPILALFDADLFLEDLIAKRMDFCSPLLVNAVLCFACQGYSAIDPEAAGFSYSFFSEAEKWYHEEKQRDPFDQLALTTVAATQLLGFAATCHGRDHMAELLFREGVELGRRTGLFGVQKNNSARQWLDDQMNWVRYASYTAWGTFCLVTSHGMNFHIGRIDVPPWLPIPGTMIDRGDGRQPGISVLPSYMGSTFTELCRLMPIIHQMLLIYYDGGDRIAPISRASFDFAEDAYGRLLKWSSSLPPNMTRRDQMPHHAAVAHIQYHAAILDLFRPFLKRRCFAAEHHSPNAIYAASVNQLKHLILVYRNRYPSATYCISWHNALLYVANSSLQQSRIALADDNGAGEGPVVTRDPHWRAWFLTCIAGYRSMAPCFHLCNGIVQSLLGMAIMNNAMTAAEGRAEMEELKAATANTAQYHQKGGYSIASRGRGLEAQVADGRDNAIGKVDGSMLMIDLDTASVNPNGALLDVLVHKFDELAMFDEFVMGETMEEQQTGE